MNTTSYAANSDNQLTSATAHWQGITVTGYVEPGPRSNKWYASTAAARGQQSAVSGQNGTFAIPGVPVTGGANALTVTVTDVSGNIATQVVNVTVVNGSTAIGYDANGNQTNHNGWAMAYDRENRLVSASSAALAVNYSYDTLGRQVQRIAGNSTNRLYYAGWQLIAECDGDGNLQRKYVYGPGIDEPVRMISGSTNYYYHSDGLGSATEITDSTGSVVEQYRYDVYGAPTFYNASGVVTNSSAIGNRLLFTGRDRDPDTGWYNYRYRYYNPSLGRFVQPDPIGLAGEDIHLYRYSLNNPTSWTDPTGLAVLQVTRQDGSIQTYYRPTSATIQQVLQQATNSGNLVDSMRIKGHGATELIMLDGNDFLIVDNMGRITDQSGKDLTDMFSKGVAQSGAIDLAGCQTGRGKDNIAKRMSNTLPNRVISGGKGLYQLGIPFMANAIGKKNFYMDGNLVHSQWTK